MIASILVIIAGWYRNIWAAIAILVVSLAIQAALVLPAVIENRRVLSISDTDYIGSILVIVIELIVIGGFFYFVGWGLRWLKDRRKQSREKN